MDFITLKIDVRKLKKEKFYEGKKGTYADLILIPTPDSEYGDYLVKQRGKKEEELPILGNAEHWNPDGKREEVKEEPKDDLPF